MIAQSFTSIIQVKYYQKFIASITDEYKENSSYEFYTDVSKGKLLKTIVAVVVDSEGRIVSCHVCRGFTVFARFKEDTSYRGVSFKWFSEEKAKKARLSPVEATLANVYSRKMETVTGN
jgi:DNA-binding transcriptional regulator of glucitol operon